jgi:poly(A) polymerase Pap1
MFWLIILCCAVLIIRCRYHRAKTTPNLTTFVFENNLISSLSPSSIRPLNTYRDTAYLLNTISDLPSYRVAHRFLSLYLKRRGLYSAKFGYLGGIHLSLMLNRVVKLIPIATNDKISTSTIIRTFFAYYSTFDWAKDVLTDPELDINPTRSAREAVFIHAIHTPTARPNVASSCTRLSAQTFSAEFSLAATKLEEGNWAWCLRPKDEVVTEFSNAFGAFVRIAIDVWDIDEMGGERVREIVGGLESKLTRLLVGLGRLSHIEARVWPARLRTPPISCNEKEETDENQLKGYYLVGISAHEDDTERKKLLTSKIISTVREFETSVKEAKEFQGEGANVWLSMDLFPKKKVLEMNLVLDERNWGAGSGKVVR